MADLDPLVRHDLTRLLMETVAAERRTTLLVRVAGTVHDSTWAVHDVGLEQLVLAYMRHPQTTALPRPALAAVPPDATEVSR